ncbi:MAG: lamin tail domain-containing protein [Candidatus Marinimicrobia bacterium]|nr:lamin tail domain-containing protein [Candidatus Neomarinimicrobiota bacterium]MCF7829717.1 lamin tail domain-containing protein [Candidatus Neomarinimicrobiota bacterium]MCF7881667.1 lamin tail domain-containing protein [Candidatus Neomarinimicrobiota bacterium]
MVYASEITGQQSIRINEFVASNSATLADADGDYSDWLEIYNPTSEPVDLSGWSLTDDEADSTLWTFPPAQLSAGEYMVVYASGKNFRDLVFPLHTNFKIDADGEYLALYDADGTVVTSFTTFPKLPPDVAYCYNDGNYALSTTPTPGAKNIITGDLNVTPPVFSRKHGIYDALIEVEITSANESVQIYYTTDGRSPSAGNSNIYSGPINIQTTTVLRAVAVDGEFSSAVTTATYLFPDDVLTQPNAPKGYPEKWGSYIDIDGEATADYGMDPEVVHNPGYSGQMNEALLSIPTLSIVTNKNYLFSHSTDPDTGGIYIYTAAPGAPLGTDWERPASVEFFNSQDGLDFQEDCGIKIHGGHSRRPEKSPKHSFRLPFKDEYGKTKLNYPLFGEEAETSLNQVVLRGTFGNSWLHWNTNERERGTLLRDPWAKDTQLDMGHPAAHGRFVHLYLNGIYWGVYNATERVDEEFAEEYLGGDEVEYDLIKDYGEVAEGRKDAWDELIALAGKDVSDDANYYRILGKNADGTDNPEYESYLDIENFIDYMIIHFYAGNVDWDHHNWIAARNRVNPGAGFKFFSWDSERIFENVNTNILSEDNHDRPSGIFQDLTDSEIFLRLFADRVQEHLYSDGALTNEAVSQRLQDRANEIEIAIIAESARWGDYRRDVHRWANSPFELYTKVYWNRELARLTEDYFPERGDIFIDQLRDANLFPAFDAPVLLINGRQISGNKIHAGDTLSLSSPNGTMYYTLDGTDPAAGDGIASTAIEYSTPIKLYHTTPVKARLYYRNEWSALTQRVLVLPGDQKKLKITEIHYHPLQQDTIDDKYFEFLELKNTDTTSLSLAGNRFIEGVSYTFSGESVIPPGEFLVLASAPPHFNQRYGVSPHDKFTGAIDNSGERIVMVDAEGDTLINIRYDDSDPWPVTPDGAGHSLVSYTRDPVGDQNDPRRWRASASIHGSPGTDDEVSTGINGPTPTEPSQFTLYQNYPNPFNPETRIRYYLKDRKAVNITVYDLRGNEITILVDEVQSPGQYHVTFDATRLASGIYFYKLTSGHLSQMKKMIILK